VPPGVGNDLAADAESTMICLSIIVTIGWPESSKVHAA